MKPHQEQLTAAIAREGEAQRALLAGEHQAARAAFLEAAELYRSSWENAPPTSYGRLVGMLKAAVLAGGGDEEAAYARNALAGQDEGSVTAAYAHALAALISEDDVAAERMSQAMRGGSEPFDRTARAIAALATRDDMAYTTAINDIVQDFEQRSEHLTGVAIADTALVLQRLAARRGMAIDARSDVLPAT